MLFKLKFTNIILISVFLSIIATFYSCDGLFPSAAKTNIPSDHTTNYGGFLHKGGRTGSGPDACGPCHTTDLRGEVSLINGVYTWANSCFQCHGNVWERNGNGNK